MAAGLYFIQQYSSDQFVHGGVGYTDAEELLLRKNFKPLLFPHYRQFTVTAKLSRFLYLLKAFYTVKRGSTVIFIFPVFARLNKLLIRLLGMKKGVRLICFVADIDGIKDGDDELLRQETRELRKYRYFIVHNDAMRDWISERVPGTNIAAIGFFDFLVPAPDIVRRKDSRIVFAGNLAKSKFLEKLYLLKPGSPGLFFNLYGPGCTEGMRGQENVSFNGVFPPAELPGKLEGSFGLVWDGDAIEGPGGSLGDYMRYISHHKLSLYIVSGLPLIVPVTAASAVLVQKYNIGIVVNSLYEIAEKISLLPEEKYQQMRQNMKVLAQKITSGNCLGEAIQVLMNK